MSCETVGPVLDHHIRAHPEHAVSRAERPERQESYEGAGRTEAEPEGKHDVGRGIERQDASERSDTDEHRVKEHEAERGGRSARREPAVTPELVSRPSVHDEREHPCGYKRDNGFAHSSKVLRAVGTSVAVRVS